MKRSNKFYTPPTFKERLTSLKYSFLFWKGRKKGMIHTRSLKWGDLRYIFFPKDFAEKYGYLGTSVWNEDGVYFKSYTAAIEAARAAALKKGFEVEEDEMFTKVGMNSKRPSVGKTTKVSLELIKNGKPQRKMLHIQVYGMKNGYELNSYIN